MQQLIMRPSFLPVSFDEFYPIFLAPIAHGLFGCLDLKIVPAFKGFLAFQQAFEFLKCASLAEYVLDLIEVVWQVFSREVERERLAQTKRAFVGNRDVF